jgi:hypothetical protein
MKPNARQKEVLELIIKAWRLLSVANLKNKKTLLLLLSQLQDLY